MALPKMKNQAVHIGLRQYVDNPSGKGSSYLASRKMIRQSLNVSFVQLLQRHRNVFYAVPYVFPSKDILFHVKVPSEGYTDNKIAYDILFLIKFEKDKRYSMRDIQVFSNSPSFLYTYAYVMYHDNLMIPECINKFPMICLTQPPVVRNPVESLGYEKSTYCAARYLLDGFCLTDNYINRHGKKVSGMSDQIISKLLGSISDPERLVSLYAFGKRLKAKKPKRPMTSQEKQMYEKNKRLMVKQNKEMKPKVSLLKKAPKAKLTAKRAKEKLLKKK